MPGDRKVSTCLWFNGNAEEAASYYTSVLPDSRITHVFRVASEGPALIVEFMLAGAPFQAFNGGPDFKLNEAVSISVSTEDQVETDRLWEALLAGGGGEGRCGWLKDRFGMSWQIVPKALTHCLESSDRVAADRAMRAMLGMRKIDIAAVEAAYRGE